MPQIEVSQEDLEFLQNLAKEMREQDNRCTASPYFYVAVVTNFRYVPDGEGFKNVWIEQSTGDCGTYDTLEEALADGWEEEDLQEFGVIREHKHHNVFLTEKSAKHYVERNGHKLGSDEPVYDYVDYADRNPEMSRLLEILRQIK